MNTPILVAHMIYVVIMLIGAAIIFYMIRNPKGIPKIDYVLAGLVPIWSGLAYFSVYLGQGTIERDGRIVYIARYVDWLITTPLLLLSLCLVAMFCNKKNIALIVGIISSDIIMIASGVIADVTTNSNRLIWFGIGVIAFLTIFYLIWFPIRKIARSESEAIGKLYTQLSVYVSLLWIGYPLTWILGQSGISILPADWDVYLFIILPVLSKVGFSLLVLSGLRRVVGTGQLYKSPA